MVKPKREMCSTPAVVSILADSSEQLRIRITLYIKNNCLSLTSEWLQVRGAVLLEPTLVLVRYVHEGKSSKFPVSLDNRKVESLRSKEVNQS